MNFNESLRSLSLPRLLWQTTTASKSIYRGFTVAELRYTWWCYTVLLVWCLCCPILILHSFFISQQMECSCLPVCWRNLSQEHGCKLFSPVRWDFIFTAQQSSQCMLSCLSPQRIEKQDARRAAFQSFSSYFGFLWHSPDSLSLHLHPLTSLCFVLLVILPRLHRSSQTCPQKMWLFGDVLIFRLILVTNLIPRHYIWVLCPSCSEDHCSSESQLKWHESLEKMQH